MRFISLYASVILALVLSPYAFSQKNTEDSQFSVHPLIIDDVLMVPLRDVADRVGLTIDIVEKEGKNEILCSYGQNCLSLSEQNFNFPRKPIIIQNKLMVPIRFVCKSLDLMTDYTKNSLVINYQKWIFDLSLKRIIIDKSKQRLYAYEGVKIVYMTHTVTGKKSMPTPSGFFEIIRKWSGWHKVRGRPWSGRMYNTLFFHGVYGIHGSTSMPHHAASHGCCRISIHHPNRGVPSPSDWLFEWATIKTPVWIFEQL